MKDKAVRGKHPRNSGEHKCLKTQLALAIKQKPDRMSYISVNNPSAPKGISEREKATRRVGRDNSQCIHLTKESSPEYVKDHEYK